MATETYPIGSIVKVGDFRGIVVGISLDEEDNALRKSYMVAAYPIGFTGAEHLRLVPAAETELVSEGYRPAIAEPFLHFMDNMDLASEYATAEELNEALEAALQKINGGDK